MQAEMPFFEGLEQALNSAIEHLGGAKAVGVKLWPAKIPDAARTRLLDSLNPSRPERLSPAEVVFILRLAREAGLHAAMQWLAAELGYEVKPITRAEEVDRVASVIEESSRTLAAAMATLERLQRVRSAA